MAGRYPQNSDKASMSPVTPISYRANVNRQKTKKWADAKPADYGGDDWGDDDEYDLPPPPVAKPTGLRQQGQGLNTGAKPDLPPVDVKKNYGDLPSLPASATSPRPRANSFDADDEKRNFSSGLARQPSPPSATTSAPATRFSQITGVPSTRDPNGHPALSISAQPAVTGLRKAIATPSPPPDALQPRRAPTGDSSSAAPNRDAGTPSDYQAHRSLSPSAGLDPLQTRTAPEHQAVRLSGQKSSPSQSQRPDSPEISKAPLETVSPKTWAGSQPTSPTSQGKALPFIRPADIYRRMEEAREKDRQSIESSRLSVDSTMGAKSGDKPDPSAQSPLEVKVGSENPAMTNLHRQSSEVDDASEVGRLQATLEPVKERRSEYGFDGFQLNDPLTADTLEAGSTPSNKMLGAEIERRQSTSPQLPNLSRLSGFGVDFLSQAKPGDSEQIFASPSETKPTGSSKEPSVSADGPILRNEPSLGFKSVVNQAFDTADMNSESSIPPTPVSRTGTGLTRSESESTGTTGISPIMSRVPSAAVPGPRNGGVGTDSIPEHVHDHTPLPPVDESTEIHGPTAPPLKPGHRRDISTPSPGNSPVRTPDLTKSEVSSSGQQAAISDGLLTSTSGIDDKGRMQPAPPISERDQSFRPSIPGRWISSDETGGPEPQISHAREQNEKYDIKPTAAKQSLSPSSSDVAVAGAALSTAVVATVGKHDEDSTVGTIKPSTDSSTAAPTPPAKDTPKVQEPEGTSDYFKVSERGDAPQVESLERPASSATPQSRTTGTLSAEEQNENLHNDIVKRLSSRLDTSGQGDLLAPDHSDDQASLNQQRISSYLPSEYENYWASSVEEETPVPLTSTLAHNAAKDPTTSQATPTIVAASSAYNETQPILPLSPRKSEQAVSSLGSSEPHHQLSAANTEDVPALSTRQGESNSPLDVPQQDRGVAEPMDSDATPVKPTAEFHGEELTDDHTGKDLAVAAGEENNHNAPSNPIDDEHPDKASLRQLPPALDEHSHHSASIASRSISPGNSARSAPATKILSFKEIAALDSTQQRIQSFDETRQRFAVMDSGLSGWMEALKSQVPEHSNVSASLAGSRMSAPSGSARYKYPRTATAGNPPGPQPYYQQYLNASSPAAPGNPAARPGTSMQSGSQQGFSPASGSKISTQQVQAKGKELLHTAGIFGGKAGKAGKGLLAKGKSRLRGGDKTLPSQQPKPVRRSSWGIPFQNPRSSSRSSPPSRHSTQHSRELSPNRTPQRQRASTLTLNTSPAPVQRPSTSDIISAPGHLIAPWAMRAAAQPSESEAAPKLSPAAESNEYPVVEDPECSDDDVVPLPVSKDLPSLDTVNTPSRRLHPMKTTDSSPTIPLSAEPFPRTGRSNGGEGAWSNAHGGPPEGDWVLISSQVEPHSDILQQPRTPVKYPPSNLERAVSPDESLMLPLSASQTRARGNSSTSILDRPRYSYDIPRPLEPGQASQSSTAFPAVYFPSLMDSPPLDANDTRDEVDPQADTWGSRSFKGLPPIRRISGIGFDFGQHLSLSGSPIDDDEKKNEGEGEDIVGDEDEKDHVDEDEKGDDVEGEKENADEGKKPTEDANANEDKADDQIEDEVEEDIDPFHALQQQAYGKSSPVETSAALRAAAGHDEDETDTRAQQPPRKQNQQKDSAGPPIQYAVPPVDSEDILGQGDEYQTSANAGHSDFPTTSEEGRKGSVDGSMSSLFTSPKKKSDATIRPQRGSFRGHKRGESSESHRGMQHERAWRSSLTGQQPPSSAQRYPDLFRPEVPVSRKPLDGDDLPPQYQSPISPEEAFLPRQQTLEYQLAGVGPPPDVERPGSRRSSGFLKEIGDRIRSVSKDRSNSISQDSPFRAEKQPNFINEYDDTESSIASDDGRSTKRRDSFFAGFNRTPAIRTGSAHDSMVAHPAASYKDLALSSPLQPVISNNGKRSIFSKISSPDEPVPKWDRLAAPAVYGSPEESGKKKRFSGLSNMFGKTTSHSSKKSTSDSIRERTSIERPSQGRPPQGRQLQGGPGHPRPPKHLQLLGAGPLAPSGPAPGGDSGRNLKTKLNIPGNFSQLRRDTKTLMPSAAGLFTGIMGKRQTQQEQPDEKPSIRSKIGPPIYHPPPFLVSRTNSDAGAEPPSSQNQEPETTLLPGNSQPGDDERDRGRPFNRDRQYPTVPIPNGYSVVRGEGETPIRTEYDPRGFNQQTDPRQAQGIRQNAGPLSGPQFYNSDLALSQGSRSPNLTIGSSDGSQRPRRLSRDGILARSPARSPEGQQRPYQLSLPGDMEDRESHPATPNNDVPVIAPPGNGRSSVIPLSPPETAQVAIIQRMTHPVLRHPQSPAGYPLPGDDVFSPVNPLMKEMPPPPAPEWTAQPDANSKSERSDKQTSVGRRIRVPGKSKLDDVLGAPDALDTKERGAKLEVIPSPSPSSGGTSLRQRGNQFDNGRESHIKTPNGEGQQMAIPEPRPSPDLYSASPQIRKLTTHVDNSSGSVGRDDKEVHEDASMHPAELDDPESHMLRRARGTQEEKIPAEEGMLDVEDHEPVTMSATSYPGQEWNPYAGGAYEEFD